jgi:TonB family protein
MRITTIILSVALHVGLATGLVAVAQKREMRRRAISVAVQEEKKKEAKPKPPPPPKPIVHAPPKVTPVVAKAEVAPTPIARAAAPAAPVATNLAMSNDDAGPGIGLLGRAPAAPKAAPAAPKVASAVTEKRTHRTEEQAGEAPCEEEPSKPVAVFKTALDYSLHPQSQADGVEGKFRARLTIDANGEVSNVEVITSVEPSLDAAVVAALKSWRFKPAMACGKPVAGGTVVVQGVFELGD